MPSVKENMKALIEQRDRLMAEMEALRNKIDGINMAISILERNGPPTPELQPVSRRSGLKAYVISLLEEQGPQGLSVNGAVEIGARRGHRLDRASVSSLLSRLKQNGTVVYEDGSYVLKPFAKPAPEHSAQAPNVTAFIPPKAAASV